MLAFVALQCLDEVPFTIRDESVLRVVASKEKTLECVPKPWTPCCHTIKHTINTVSDKCFANGIDLPDLSARAPFHRHSTFLCQQRERFVSPMQSPSSGVLVASFPHTTVFSSSSSNAWQIAPLKPKLVVSPTLVHPTRVAWASIIANASDIERDEGRCRLHSSAVHLIASATASPLSLSFLLPFFVMTSAVNTAAASAPLVPAALPETDEARLMFYAEVLMANVPVLIADLSSAKYTFLSFSEKTRNEVKQKSTLIQSIGRTFTSLQNANKTLAAAHHALDDYETKLVRAAPPTFLTSAEALRLSNGEGGITPASTATATSTAAAAADGEAHASGAPAAPSATTRRLSTAAAADNVLILNDDDIRPVRAAEDAYEAESAAFTELTASCATMELLLEEARVQCRTMTEHVQGLKGKYEEEYRGWKSAERERRLVRVMRDELEERRATVIDALHGIKLIEDECRAQEFKIIEDSIAQAQAEAESIRAELQEKRSRYELELAAYQIAYKEQQAEVEALREHCKVLRSHQRDLETLAKKQQLEETERNSLRKVMMDTLTFTPSKCGRAEERALTPEQQAQVRDDHPLVSLLAARISVLEEQRKTVGGLLVSARGMGKSEDVTATVERIRDLLEPEVQLDEDALAADP